MRRWLLLCGLLPLSAAANEHWIRFTAGPVEVMSSAGSKDARETLVKFEEYRHALGQVLGESDLQLSVPIRVLLFRTAPPALPSIVARGRNQYNVVLTAGQPIPADLYAALTKLFLDNTTARMPDSMERGLISLFSTIQVTGIRITLGEPPPHPDLDWARIHLLATDPEYYGKLRVILYNLRKGVEQGPAFRNAIAKSPEQIDLQAQLHLTAGHFQTASVSPLPMSPMDFPERQVEPAQARLALADLLLGNDSRNAYRGLIEDKSFVPEAWEGLGILALRDAQTAEALTDFSAAVDAKAKSPDCYLEYARLLPHDDAGNAKAIPALEHASKINAKLAEPHFLLAERQSDPLKRIAELKQAATLDARNLTYWQALAEAYLKDHDYSRAAQAWKSAEQAAATPGDRATFLRRRLEVEAQRLDWEDAEKKRKADEEARDIDRLKQQARADLHAMEARANAGQPPRSPDEKLVPWWNGPQPSAETNGVLKQVDCLGKRLRLTVLDDDQKSVKLLVPDAAQVAILGGAAEVKLSCGSQTPRRVKVAYFPKPDAKLATRGEVATIEFQ